MATNIVIDKIQVQDTGPAGLSIPIGKPMSEVNLHFACEDDAAVELVDWMQHAKMVGEMFTEDGVLKLMIS